jgi:hypothetical protein
MPQEVNNRYYAIDDYHQLANARSNSDPTLRIVVTDFVNSDILEGVRIQVVHPQYAVLFACLANATGRLTSYSPQSCLEPDEILRALKQLGFDVRFNTTVALNEATAAFLAGAQATGYTHVRRASVIVSETARGKTTRPIIICFNEDKRPDYLNQYIPPMKLIGGDVMRVSPDSNNQLDFSWLDFPMHIGSVLSDYMKRR